MDSIDKMRQKKSLDDLLYQRMKNRERQRRYRERKRLQENMKKAIAVNELPPLQLPPPPSKPTNGVIARNQFVNRVLCKRDWKKDARTVHMAKQQTISHCAQSFTDKNQGSSLLSGENVAEQNSKSEQFLSSNSLSLQDHGKSKSKHGGRHWKAEARNKK